MSEKKEKTLAELREDAFNKKQASWLPDKTRELFKLQGIDEGSSPRKYYPGFGEINFTKLSIAKAEQLVKMKFPYLVKINKRTASSTSTS